MEDVTKNINDLFTLAKEAKVDYSINKVTAVISGAAAATGAVGATSTFFNLSKIVIMLGSIVTVVTVAVVMNTTEEPIKNNVVNQPSIEKENIIEKEQAMAEMPKRNIIEQNELVVPIEIDPEFVAVEEEVWVEEIATPVEPDVVVTELRSVASAGNIDSFHSIHLNISADVKIVKGKVPKFDFEGSEKLEEVLDMVVSKGTLYINVKQGKRKEYNRLCRANNNATLVLTMDEVRNLVINGSGDIYSADEINSNNLSVQINGSGDVRLDKIVPTELQISVNGSGDVSLYGEGITGQGEVNINGSGDVCTKSIDISQMVININGSGDVNVSCQEQLDVTILGSGDVCYSGAAKVNSSQLGSGAVHNCEGN